MKRIMIGLILCLLIFMFYIVYNHQQNPSDQDVFNATEEWTAPIKEVLLIKQSDHGWFTISKSKQTILLAKLEQNWLGEWELRDGSGHLGTISSISSEGYQDTKLIWSASGNQSSGNSFYFGQILDPEIKRIKIAINQDVQEEAKIFSTSGNRFFVKRVNGPLLTPIQISGLNQDGKVVYSSYPSKE